MKKSLIVSWITACDYPLFRKWLGEYYDFFNEIIIYWDVQFRHPFYWAFIQQSLSYLPNIKFLDPVSYEYGVGDWRNTATNELIKHATGDWIFSIEQDWFAKDWEFLLEIVNSNLEKADLIGWENPTNFPYIHPAFFAVKREMLEKTSKDFSPHPEINGCDHFGMITHEVRQNQGKVVSLQELGFNCNFSPDSDMFHLGGVNQNYLNGLTEGFQFHRPEAFFVYNYYSTNTMLVPQDPRYLELATKIHNKLKEQFPNWTDLYLTWDKFFKI